MRFLLIFLIFISSFGALKMAEASRAKATTTIETTTCDDCKHTPNAGGTCADYVDCHDCCAASIGIIPAVTRPLPEISTFFAPTYSKTFTSDRKFSLLRPPKFLA